VPETGPPAGAELSRMMTTPRCRRVAQRLRRMCSQEGVTVYMALAGGGANPAGALLQSDRHQCGLAFRQSQSAGDRRLNRFLTNTLVMRTDLSGAPGFRELRVAACANGPGRLRHQDLPSNYWSSNINPVADFESLAAVSSAVCLAECAGGGIDFAA